MGKLMKKSEAKYADTSGCNSSTIQIDVSTSSSTYQAPTETRVVKIDSKSR
jgi:hypothetical protein